MSSMLLTPDASASHSILDAEGLATRYHTSRGYIHKLHATDPTRLPPRLKLGGRILLWRLVDVEAWEASHVAEAPVRRGRKSTAAKAQAANVDAAGRS
jgi:predicted DNA-binding transcriptional regulator AlpA